MPLKINCISKAFGTHTVLNNVTLELEDKKIYCLMGASGMGKTTLLRIILGLEKADGGSMDGVKSGEISAMFQEDRLCPDLTPVENVALVCEKNASRAKIAKNLEAILPGECLNQRACELSGGMKRRVALARAMLYKSKLVILDEPFTGLDINTRKEVISYLLKMQNDRIYLIATHGEHDAELLGGERIILSDINHIGEARK